MKIFSHVGDSTADLETYLEDVHGLELDLRMTKDGVVVVRHYRRIQNGDARYHWLESMTFAEVKSILGETLTTFEEVLVRLATLLSEKKRKTFSLDLDLKQPGMEKEIARLLKEYGFTRIIASSPDIWTLKSFEETMPTADIGLSYYSRDRWDVWDIRAFRYLSILIQFSLKPFLFRLIRRKTRKADIEVANLYHKFINEKVVDFLHQYHIKVFAWGADSEKQLGRLVQLGVDGIKTKRPDLLKQILGNYESNCRPSTS